MNKAGLHKGFWNGKVWNEKAANSGNLWRLRGFTILVILGAMALSLSAGWNEITMDNETYYLVPSSEILPNHTIKGIH